MRFILTRLPAFHQRQLAKTIIKTTLLVTEFGYYYITKKNLSNIYLNFQQFKSMCRKHMPIILQIF